LSFWSFFNSGRRVVMSSPGLPGETLTLKLRRLPSTTAMTGTSTFASCSLRKENTYKRAATGSCYLCRFLYSSLQSSWIHAASVCHNLDLALHDVLTDQQSQRGEVQRKVVSSEHLHQRLPDSPDKLIDVSTLACTATSHASSLQKYHQHLSDSHFRDRLTKCVRVSWRGCPL
jgi:hypothetical protein